MNRLALTRREHEGVLLTLAGGPTVYVHIAKVYDNGRVRLAIDAPPTVAINREEVALRILAERLDALPPTATSAEDCEAVRACAGLIQSARAVAHGSDGASRTVAQRLLDRLAGLGRVGRSALPAPAPAASTPAAGPPVSA